jgi:hypothetical protein
MSRPVPRRLRSVAQVRRLVAKAPHQEPFLTLAAQMPLSLLPTLRRKNVLYTCGATGLVSTMARFYASMIQQTPMQCA